MEEQEIDLIDYLNVIWKRKGLIIGGTLLAAISALVVSLSMPKTYEVSRTLKIGRLPDTVPIENREAVIGRLKDDRVLKSVLEKVHLAVASEEIDGHVSIDLKSNPDVRYTLQAHDRRSVPRLQTNWRSTLLKFTSGSSTKGYKSYGSTRQNLRRTSAA